MCSVSSSYNFCAVHVQDSSAVACACCWLFSLLGPSMFDKLIMQLSGLQFFCMAL